MSLGPFITKQRLFKKVNIFCFLADIFSKEKLLTFRIFNESNIWAYWKIEVSESTIVEITRRRNCYFILFNIV